MPRLGGPIVLVSLLVGTAAACGGDGSGPAAAPSTAPFCAAWTAAMASGDESALTDALRDAPAALHAQARLVRDAGSKGNDSPDLRAAVSEILVWTELNCPRGKPGEPTTRIAPPPDATFEGLTLCSTSAFPTPPADEAAGIVLYGDTGTGDAYDGPMLGLLWNPADDGSHVGDGDSQPVTVRGQPGFAAPITVFQQVVLPELGTVVAWAEGGRAFGLYGRGWPMERAGELAEIASGIQPASPGFAVAPDALPAGYGEVFSGEPGAASLMFPPSPSYSLHFQAPGQGVLNLDGLALDDAAFDAFRFFTVAIDRREVAGRDALVGNAWHADGPAVVTWREPDGLVVRIVGFGVPLEAAEDVAERSRPLSDDEWAAVVRSVRPSGAAGC
jgi:hypothetical protein